MKRWVQIAVVSILLIATANISVLNMQMMNQRREMSRIAGVSQLCDQGLYQAVKGAHLKVDELQKTNRTLVNSVSELADAIGRVEAVADDAQMAVAEHENNIRWVVDLRMRSVVTVRFEYLYRQTMMGQMPVNPKTGKPWYTSGAGVIIDKTGVVLTCAHLLDSGEDQQWGPITRAWIRFEDGTERDITNIAYVPECKPDVGVVKFDPNGLDLTAVPMVPEMRKFLHKGDQVVVLGAPRGYEHSVEVGTLAAPYRSTTTVWGDEKDLIQLSAHIMGGNSGGPVFDMSGNLLGIVMYIHGREGAAFVVPVELALEGLGMVVEVPFYGGQ